jgi:large repetitive protein
MTRLFARTLVALFVAAVFFAWGRPAAAQGSLAFSIDDVTVVEGDAGQTNAVFTVRLSGRHLDTVRVKLQLANGSARIGPDVVNVTADPNNLPTLTFGPNVLTQQFTVPVIGERLHEADETYFLNLVQPEGAAIADGQGRGTITNDDPIPALRVADLQLNEGQTGARTVIIKLILSNPSARAITVRLVTADETATAGQDYDAIDRTVTIAAGKSAVAVPITIHGDTTHEPNEQLTVTLSSPTNATLGDADGLVVIRNDDTAPAIAIDSASVIEGNAGTTTTDLRVRLSNASSAPVTVDFTTGDSSAVQPEDYVAASGTVTFEPGQLTQSIALTTNGDTLFEGSERVLVTLSNPANGTLATATAALHILNDDQAPTFSVDDSEAVEGTGGTSAMTFTVRLSAPAGTFMLVNAATVDGSATAPSDYAARSSRLIFQPGQTEKPFVVSLVPDRTREPFEHFSVRLTALNGTELDKEQGIIRNDDAVPSITISDKRIGEGHDGTRVAVLVLRLSNPSSAEIRVNYATADSSARAGSDYVATSGTVTFAPGQEARAIGVVVNGDAVVEPDQAFLVNLSSPFNAVLADAQAAVTIVNDDPFLSIGDVAVLEGNSGTRNMIFTVTLSGPSNNQVTVKFATENGTAVAGSDYIAQSGTLTFAPGQTSAVINVPVQGDTTSEVDERLAVRLSFPTNAFINDGLAGGLIRNDD